MTRKQKIEMIRAGIPPDKSFRGIIMAYMNPDKETYEVSDHTGLLEAACKYEDLEKYKTFGEDRPMVVVNCLEQLK